MVMNSAFVFVKPHANTDKAREVVKAGLEAKKVTVLKEGLITGKEIDEKQLIDNHYYAIASKATILKPAQLNVPKKMFQDKFGKDWDETLAAGLIFNAKDACEKLGIDSEELNTNWAKSKKAGKLVKFGGGFYCGLVDTVEGKDPIYVMNGFFMSMRSNYVVESASIYYFVVQWDSKELSWEDFRGSVLGPTDPVTAPEDSLRGMFYKNWESYGLSSIPNVGDNAVHASASPFEALAEKMNWIGMKADEDQFGQALLKFMDTKTLSEWSKDAQVTYGPVPIKKSVFDSVEDTDAPQCLALLGMMYVQSESKVFDETCAKLQNLRMGA
ncbi:unnamed protein product [Amoebophrya sp. A25]|nr:unnamed protein product [Amoebophrya sp. A25]|eukprot:GSA25T00001434001.1